MFAEALPEKTFSLLKKIYPLLKGRKFYLPGGSGLALQIGHRVSEDLAFFTGRAFEVSSQLQSLKPNLNRLHEILNEVQVLSADLDGIRCSFFYYDVPLLLDLVSFRVLKIADWKDILAEKFKTVAQRGSKKDFSIFFARSG